MEFISSKSLLLRASWECTELLLLQRVHTRGHASLAGISFGCCTWTCQWVMLQAGASHLNLLESGLDLRRSLQQNKITHIMLQNDL